MSFIVIPAQAYIPPEVYSKTFRQYGDESFYGMWIQATLTVTLYADGGVAFSHSTAKYDIPWYDFQWHWGADNIQAGPYGSNGYKVDYYATCIFTENPTMPYTNPASYGGLFHVTVTWNGNAFTATGSFLYYLC